MDAEVHENFLGKRLVVFGCGDVGGCIARQAHARGMKVAALTRNSAKAESLRRAGIKAIVAELSGHGWHAEVGGAPDYVLNSVSSGGGGIEAYRQSYLRGMESIAEWSRVSGSPGIIAYTSSTSVYPQDHGAAVDESADVHARNDRSAVLIEAEQVLLARAESGAGAPIVRILRLAGIYGPGRVHLVEQVRSGEVSGTPEHHLNLIHRDDVAAAFWSVLARADRGSERIFNVVDDAPARKGEVVRWLAERLNIPQPRFTGESLSVRRGVTPDRLIVNRRLKATTGWTPRYPTYREGYEKILSL